MSPEQHQLAPRIARQIEASGPISVAEYMRQANAEYYSRADPLGVDGDFITAPEISQIYGELIGMWLTDMWMRQGEPALCHYVELGPGRGTLAADALRSMAQYGFEPTVHFVETSEALRTRQAQAVPQARFHDAIDDLPTDAPLLVVANEFFDALPIRQFIVTHAGWRERVVVRDGNHFAPAPGTYTMDNMVPASYENAPVDSIFELGQEAGGILYGLAARLSKQGGVLLIADYGYTEPSLGDSLQAVRAHQYANVFECPGEQDLTAHVDFPNLANIATAQGLRVDGPIPQGDFLQALGIDQRAAMLARNAPEQAEAIVIARQRLVNAEHMGTLFKMLAISSPNWAAPEGFSAFTA